MGTCIAAAARSEDRTVGKVLRQDSLEHRLRETKHKPTQARTNIMHGMRKAQAWAEVSTRTTAYLVNNLTHDNIWIFDKNVEITVRIPPLGSSSSICGESHWRPCQYRNNTNKHISIKCIHRLREPKAEAWPSAWPAKTGRARRWCKPGRSDGDIFPVLMPTVVPSTIQYLLWQYLHCKQQQNDSNDKSCCQAPEKKVLTNLQMQTLSPFALWLSTHM